ncbi:hypothetical protein AX15_002369 [Amanita polypyramis BW_CC]|nr:hypothetical protein AX15_002369 [Amanita polypyramis BW_CC]
MPAPASRLQEARPVVNHVNLMVDTFIANASVEDLRSISRCLLATGPAGIVPAFLNAAHTRLTQTNAKAVPNKHTLFTNQPHDTKVSPTEDLYEALTRARKLFGSGLGLASLGIFTAIVWGTVGLRWDGSGDMTDILAAIDGDITQAIQSCKEEISSGRISDHVAAVNTVNELKFAISQCQVDVESWGGEFPFDRASLSLELWNFGV